MHEQYRFSDLALRPEYRYLYAGWTIQDYEELFSKFDRSGLGDPERRLIQIKSSLGLKRDCTIDDMTEALVELDELARVGRRANFDNVTKPRPDDR